MSQEKGEGLESNVSCFFKDFWLHECRNKFSELRGKIGIKVERMGVSAYPVSSKDINYDVFSQTMIIMWCLCVKEAKKWKEKGIRKESSKVWWRRYPFLSISILILFSCNMMFTWYGEILWNPWRCLTWFVLEITADSNCLRDFLLRMGWIRVAWVKLKLCLSSNMWEKKVFQSPFVLIDYLCS